MKELTVAEAYNRGVIAGLQYALYRAQGHASQYHDHKSPIHDFCKILANDIEEKIPQFIKLGTLDPAYLDNIKNILRKEKLIDVDNR